MIAVIADDITGAAELAGIALRYGLSVDMSDRVPLHILPEVLVLYTNTRSMAEEEAVAVMKALTGKVQALGPSLLYKKTDSVLRGHVLAEMQSQMKVMGWEKGLLVPANPSLGRIIRNGYYYVQDQPIHTTGFSEDPEFPVKDSHVLRMLRVQDLSVNIVPALGALPDKGIAVGEASTDADIAAWANYQEPPVFLAGGAAFFQALLAARHLAERKTGTQVQPSTPLLLVSGTTFRKNVDRIRSHPHLVSYMPEAAFSGLSDDQSSLHGWAEDVLSILARHDKAIIAVDNAHGRKGDPVQIRMKKAELVRLVLGQAAIKELLVEGGATAYSILEKLKWHSFTPSQELLPGVVRMKVEAGIDMHLTIKPGSYPWPVEWNFN